MKTVISLIVGCVFCVQISAQASCDPPPSGIVSWWPAEGNANDIIGTNNGTLMNGTGFTNGEVGMAFNLNGVNNFVLVNLASPTNLDIGEGGGFTIEGWINPASLSSSMMLVQYERVLGGVGSDVGIQFAMNANAASGLLPGCLSANLVDTSEASHIFGSAANVLTAGVWQHVAVTYDKTSGIAVLYTNGVPTAQANLGVFTPQTIFTNVLLGATTDYSSPTSPRNVFSGQMDEMSMYNRALGSNEIAAIYQAGSAGKCITPTPPVITTQPVGQTNAVGNTATLTVQANGTAPLFYQWQFDGTNLPTATNSALTLSNLSTDQTGIYDVVVTNSYGSVTSNPAMLDVLFLLVEVNGQPAFGTVTALAPATVSILGGYPGGYIFYTLDGTNSPTTSSTLYTGPFILTNSAVVQTLALSSDFSQQTNGIPVTIQIVPTYTLQTSITGSGTLSTNPPGGIYASNTLVTLTASPALHWTFANWAGDTSGSQNPLSITMDGSSNIQAVFVQNAYPLTLTTPGGGTVTANGATISASTYYATDSVVTLAATPASGWIFLGWQGTVSGTNNPLRLVITQTNNIQGIFGTIAATNAAGGAVVLSVPNPVPYGTALAVSAVPNPGNYFVNWTGNYVFGTFSPVRYTATVPNPTFGALFTPLPAGKISLAVVVNGPGFVNYSPQSSYYSSNATVQLTPLANSGAYFFGWTQGATGRNSPLSIQVTSNTIIQANFGVAPTVGISPLNQTVFAGSNAVLTASAMGLSPLTYQWQNGQGIIPGATNTTYTISNTQPTNAGSYWLVVSSSVGSVTSAVATVTVIGSPSITNQPASATVSVGHTASFVVGVYGAPALAYQWQLNGTNLAWATNAVLTLPNAFPANAGAYTVTITNAYGSATSSPAAWLTVLPLDIIAPNRLANGQFQFTFDTASGINYEVEYSTNLLDWYVWLTLGGNGQPLTLSDPNTAGTPQRYYRILLSPQ